MSDDILLSAREREAWERMREMGYNDATESIGITQNTLEGHLEKNWMQYAIKGYDFRAGGVQ